MDDEAPLLSPIPRGRGIFCNRTLNLRTIRAIGYDMDYTLVHYVTEAWERRAYEHLSARLASPRLARRGSRLRPVLRHPRAGARPRARQHREGEPLRLRQARLPRHRAALLRGAAARLRPHDRRSLRAALGLPQHVLLALRGLHVRAARRSPRPAPHPRGPRLRGPLRVGEARPRSHPHGGRAQGRDHRRPRAASSRSTPRCRSRCSTSSARARSSCSSRTPSGSTRAR